MRGFIFFPSSRGLLQHHQGRTDAHVPRLPALKCPLPAPPPRREKKGKKQTSSKHQSSRLFCIYTDTLSHIYIDALSHIICMKTNNVCLSYCLCGRRRSGSRLLPAGPDLCSTSRPPSMAAASSGTPRPSTKSAKKILMIWLHHAPFSPRPSKSSPP